MSISDPASARQFVNNVDLPDAPEFGIERGGDPTALPVYEAKEQAVAVGSQIAEFSKRVPAPLRPAISNSFLLAQLAANKHLSKTGGNSRDWYAKYNEVLANIGWVVEDSGQSMKEVKGSGLQVHQEILPLVTAALGPAVAAAAIVTATLKGLANMNKDSPWITLFDHQSQRAHANQFQVAYIDAPQSSMPVITLAGFELDAKRSVTQVLFFKVSSAEAKLRHYSSKVSMNQGVFDAVQGAVQQKVASFVAGYVAAVDI
jgi:hypothetical protein